MQASLELIRTMTIPGAELQVRNDLIVFHGWRLCGAHTYRRHTDCEIHRTWTRLRRVSQNRLSRPSRQQTLNRQAAVRASWSGVYPPGTDVGGLLARLVGSPTYVARNSFRMNGDGRAVRQLTERFTVDPIAFRGPRLPGTSVRRGRLLPTATMRFARPAQAAVGIRDRSAAALAACPGLAHADSPKVQPPAHSPQRCAYRFGLGRRG